VLALSPIRWGDNDRYFGPFTFAANSKHHRTLALELSSGDGEDYPRCNLRLSLIWFTLILALPPIIRPHVQKIQASWDAETTARLGRDYYVRFTERTYGFSYYDRHLCVYYGRQGHDSRFEQRWGTFLPWTQWRFVRHSLYGLNGEHFLTEPTRPPGQKLGDFSDFSHYEEWRQAIDACPSATFAFLDYDGEALTARCMLEEREWHFGEGWFKWLSFFRRPMIRRSLDIQFSGETGRRKGSWKGGALGHGIDVLPGEGHEAAFRRYCAEHEMTFVGPVEPRE